MAGYEGTVVLNYRLVRKLGEGGFGAVFLAEHTELGRKVACKILHREFADKADIVERFFREARSVCAIGHRAIVQIENFGRLPDGEPFYLMEYLSGESLADRIKRRPLRVEEALAVFEPVASALAAAHAKQIIHRDLKPENIMIREERGMIVDVKLLDFGVAKLAQEADAVRSRSGVPMGTPSYMPPEQARDAKHVDERGDVYSFAATMYAAFAGRPPFVADSVAGVILKVQVESPPPLRQLAPHVPGRLQQVLERCLAKEPQRRPPTIHEAWGAIRAASGVSASPAPAHLHPGVAVTLPDDASLPTVPPGAAAHVATTLGSSAGQQSHASSKRNRWIWITGLVAVSGAGLAVAALVGFGGSGSGSGSTLTSRVAIDAAIVSQTIAVDAAPAPTLDAFVVPVEPPDPVVTADITPTVTPPQPAKNRPHKPDPPKPDPARLDRPKPARTATDPPALDCSVDSFARIYNAASPPDTEVNAALARLKQCQSQLPPEQFKLIQRQLVGKL